MKINLKRFNIEETDVFRLISLEKRNHKIADSALNGDIIPFLGFDSVPLSETMWQDRKTKKYGHSHTLYMHSLRVVAELLLAFEDTDKIEYFYQAKKIFNLWIRYEKSGDTNKMIWYDHATANRLQVIIHFIYISNKLNAEYNYDDLEKLLMRHAEVLEDDTIYNYNNHALMMDRALIVLGNVLNNELLRLKGKYRAIQTFFLSYSYKGVHLENSPQYHKMVTNWYKELELYLNSFSDSLGERVLYHLEMTDMYIPIATRPNQKLVNIGDSGSAIQDMKKVYKNFYDVEAGIAVLQRENPSPFFVTFTAGYSSRVHKHHDDLGITLNYNKVDFLVDPGNYGYSQGRINNYIKSKEAHSTFHIKDRKYKINNENRYERNIALSQFVDNSAYTLVKGIHEDYEDVDDRLLRAVILFKQFEIVIIIDEVENSSANEVYRQVYNLESNVNVEDIEDKIILKSDGEQLVIQQFVPDFKKAIVKGDENIPIAINASAYKKTSPSHQVIYENRSSNQIVFVTGIYDDREIESLEIKLFEESIIVNIDGNVFEILI